ncbi:uncharacterized protein N7483_004240 [Penicillium malachiteum]|uniref:uncharacterized protein n=1 Tax=Penicillium malachiteum TaxID=1324776 RepID=UPI002548091E|nr:uncharacterized protein N7483_004240 [Penicillium malachiteum]KAJ5729732.1 hypothetical protein N7483_004240 [Penicillium malachiteum]
MQVQCSDNCKRSGAGNNIIPRFNHWWNPLDKLNPPLYLYTIFEAFSVNCLTLEADLTLQDPRGALKIFEDPKTASGNIIEIIVLSSARPPEAPGQVFLKATLFDSISPKEKEVFGDKRLQL